MNEVHRQMDNFLNDHATLQGYTSLKCTYQITGYYKEKICPNKQMEK